MGSKGNAARKNTKKFVCQAVKRNRVQILVRRNVQKSMGMPLKAMVSLPKTKLELWCDQR